VRPRVAVLITVLALATLPTSSAAQARGRRDYSRAPAITRDPVLDTLAPVQVRALVLPETVYVGQQATYQVAAFFARAVRDRVRRPEFFAPEMRGMLAYESPSDLPAYTVSSRGKSFEAFVYQRAIFPVAAGRFTIPSARLTYALPLTASFFSRDETYEARSDSIVVVAIDPPAAGRPAEFQGAVGALSIAADLDTGQARVGDPLVLRVRVAGVGNVKLLPRPPLRVPWATVVSADERVTVATDRDTVRGAKEFDWVLTPTRPGMRTLPPVRYWYFDPWTESYQLAEAAPDSVLVAPGALASSDTGTVVVPPLPIRTTYRGALPVPPHERREFWLLLGLAPIPATLRRLTSRRRARIRPEPVFRDLRALARQRRPVSPGALRRALVRALADRLHVGASTLSSNGALARAARRAGVSAAVANEADALLAELDRAAFGAAHEKVKDAAKRGWRVYRAIDREARSRDSLRTAVTGSAIAVMLIVLAHSAFAIQGTELDPARRFDAGVAAYRAGRYSDAARDFGAAATAEPRAPDAWMNYGSASWEAADTARAVVGWQRALRLEPLATDAREALVLVDLPVDESFGDVPPLPVASLALIAASLWCLAWLAVAIRTRKAGATTVALGGIALSVALAAVAFTAHSAVSGRGLAVVDATGALRVLPALAAEYGASARVGEVARIAERRGDWTRIALAGAREGWVEHALLVQLTRD
jgi:tetratricopeptide (TPR) repeat protein